RSLISASIALRTGTRCRLLREPFRTVSTIASGGIPISITPRGPVISMSRP
ncbi:unnamed protein product, partial [Arabidopsis halleri]